MHGMKDKEYDGARSRYIPCKGGGDNSRGKIFEDPEP
jgi:hypothetical protein